MSHLEIIQIPCLTDNYAVVIHARDTGETLAIDAPDAPSIIDTLKARSWQLTHLFNTHHHADHTGGNLALKAHYGCMVVGPEAEEERIPGIDRGVAEGSLLQFAGKDVTIIETPGHTIGHVSYFFGAARIAFTGDTLFSLGCGRIFEGTAEMMWNSLQKLIALPDDTTIYCGHEYTANNARFAVSLEPENEALQARADAVTALRAANKPTVPTSLAVEKATNPFLRPQSRAIRARLGLEGAPDVEVFGRVRQLKNKS